MKPLTEREKDLAFISQFPELLAALGKLSPQEIKDLAHTAERVANVLAEKKA